MKNEKTKSRSPAERPSITIGGIAIAPGSRAVVNIPIAELSTHTPMNMPVQVIHGREDGPRLFVCGATHGDEINGIEIIRRLLRASALKRLHGTLIAVPIVNVTGFVFGSRYLPDRRDLNRVFPGSAGGSLAGRLAKIFVSEIVSKSTHGIDLHTGALHRENFPQVRANFDDPVAEKLALAFGVPIVVNTGFRPGSLRQAAADLSVPVIVYEAGEALRFSEPCIRAGVKGVIRVMRELGMLAPGKRKKPQRRPLAIRSTTWVRAPRSGLVRLTKALGSTVRMDEALGAISDPFGEHEDIVRSPARGIIIGRTNNPLVHEGDALFHIARHEGTQVVAQSLEAFEPEADYKTGSTSELSKDPPIV